MKKLFFPVLLFASLSVSAQTNIGVQLYSFRNEFKTDIPGTLEKLSKMGVTEVEGGGSYGMSVPDFKALLDKNKLDVTSIGVDFKRLETDVQGVVDEAKLYGAKYVMCAWIPHTGDDFTLEDANKAINVFNTAGKLLKENGITFCYHAHGFEFRPYSNETLFDHLAKNMNPQYANFEMDVFWIKHPGQDPVALLKKYPGRFKMMHLKDRKPGTEGNQNGHADVETNVVLGSGDVGIAAIMKVAKKYGVEKFYIEDESSRSLEQVPQSLAFLKSLK
jgi:sugar phosphate isomerase/epimerase